MTAPGCVAPSHADYQREHNSGVSSVQQIKDPLPAAAQGVLPGRDRQHQHVAHARELPDEVERLRPRHPLFGGWRTTIPWLHGARLRAPVPQRRLRAEHAAAGPLFDDMVVDELEVLVVLPRARRSSWRRPTPCRQKDSVLLTWT